MLRKLFLIIIGSFFLYSCGFDSSLVIKRIDFLQQQVNLNSQRITENSTRINNIEQRIEKIKERLAKERTEDNFLAQIPPAAVIDNVSTNSMGKVATFRKDNNTENINNIGASDNKTKASYVNNVRAHKKLTVIKKVTLKKAKLLKKVFADKSKQRLVSDKLYKKALSLYFSRKYDKAKKLFKKFLSSFNKSNSLYDNAMFWLAYCYIHENNTIKAVNLFKKLINEFPYEALKHGGKTDEAIYTLIKIYKKEGKVSKIVKYKKLLLKRFPNSKYSDYIRKGERG